MKQETDERWMREALALAKQAWGDTHPNPMVGALLVAGEKILASGYHAKAGELHAERMALKNLNVDPSLLAKATLYVTLEPCCTHGRTPPCTSIILERGIRRVVVGAIDPNPAHAGKGLILLRQAGVEVVEGVLAKECEDQNLIFFHRMRNQRPMLVLKSAVSLDGKIASSTGKSQWITGEDARRDVMRWRRYFPGIAVGAGTAIADNPSLTVRDGGRVLHCPMRLVFDRSLKTMPILDDLALFNDDHASSTVLVTAQRHPISQLARYRSKGCQVIALPYEKDGGFPRQAFLEACVHELKLDGLMIEGGSSLSTDLIRARAIDYLMVYQAPILMGQDATHSMLGALGTDEPSMAPRMLEPIHETVGHDLLTRGHLSYS
jgi:diaminohydroxyphosphoribosylaminopyrimidine deaminase / 5-amino-6-(5-phosphoribosylamino)uracil reductase